MRELQSPTPTIPPNRFDLGILPVVSDFLLQRASHELPRHMLPSKFVLMQRLPLTPNGSLDTQHCSRACHALQLVEGSIACNAP